MTSEGRRPDPRDTSRCFVCGADNPIGLRLVFEDVDGGIRTTFTPSADHVGWAGVVHGGILAAVLDDALANVFARQGRVALVGRLELRFRQPVAPGETLVVRAEATGARSRAATARAWLERRNGAVVATATGTLMIEGAAR